METVNEFANEIPVNDNLDGGNAEALNEANSTEVSVDGLPSATTEPELDGLQPAPVEAPLTVEYFGTPLEAFEIDNITYALTDIGDAGVNVLIALENNNYMITDEIIADAKAVGVSQRQIDGYISHQVNVANKAFNDAGLTFSEGRDMMKRVDVEFSTEEREIFMRETNEDSTKSLQTLKAYFELENR